jgi:hypothetical protein
MKVIGTPKIIHYYGKSLKPYGMYKSYSDAKKQARQINDTSKYLAIPVESYKNKDDNMAQFTIVYYRKRLQHEVD